MVQYGNVNKVMDVKKFNQRNSIMGMYIFNNEQDREKYKKVSDHYVNIEFQEALKYEPGLIVMEIKRIKKTGLFKKNIEETIYQVYHETSKPNEPPYQARYQFSGSGTKEIFIAYLHGLINGYHILKPKELKQE